MSTRNLRLSIIALLGFIGACAEEAPNLALGVLERDRVTLSATASELITEMPVREGTEVKTGDLIVQLDDRLQVSMVLKAEAEVLQAEAFLDKLTSGARIEEVAAARARVAAARALLVESERDFERIQQMVAGKLVAQAEYETAESRRDNRRAALDDVEEQLRLLVNGSRIEDIHQGEAQLKAAEAVLEREQQYLSNLSVIATRDGILNSLPWSVGDRVFVGAPLAIVLANVAPFARVYIPEPSRANVRVGGEFQVHVDGVDEVFSGIARWVSIEPAFTPYYALNSTERSRLMYLAEIELEDSARSLPTGLPVQVELP